MRSEAAEATRRRLEAAAAAKEAEEREAAAQRASRRAPHRVGGLSAEEKAARLAEMQQNAEAHDRDRGERLQRAEDRDAAEDGEVARGGTIVPTAVPSCTNMLRCASSWQTRCLRM